MIAKRICDILASIVLLTILSPFMLVEALLVWASVGSPIIFRQRRPGLDGRLFTLYKFRTMREARGKDGEPLPDIERLSRVGAFLRKCSLDELPELYNVLKGDMSIVGPRPLLEEYLECYTPEQARRHEVRPGITGLAQISGREDITFSHRIALDTYYVDNRSLWLDFKIILGTIPKVLGRGGVRPDQGIDTVDDIGLNPTSSAGRAKRLARMAGADEANPARQGEQR